MSRWPKIPNREKTEAMLRQAAELGLGVKDSCIYAHISYAYYKEHREWTKPAYESGKMARSQRALGPGVLAAQALARRQRAIADRMERDQTTPLTPEEMGVMTMAHRWAMDEHRRLSTAERRKIEWREYMLKKRALEMRAEEQAAEHMSYIPIATPMTPEEMAAYAADDYIEGERDGD